MTPPVSLVLDISNLLSKAWHSVERETDKPLGLARYRSSQMLKVLLREVEPDRLIGALDWGKSFRHRLLPPTAEHAGYKGHRKEKGDDLRGFLGDQPYVLAQEFGIELVRSPDHEADDAIAAIADKSLAYGVRVLIYSADKDLYQLVHDDGGGKGIFILQQDKGGLFCITPEKVQEKMGVPPHKVALFKALSGDPGDGVPGIKSCGPVMGKRLANRYASMTHLFKHLDALTGAERKKLEAHGLEYALLMERLTTLVRDAPLESLNI